MFPMKSREPALLSLALLVFSPPLAAQRLELANDLTQAGAIEEMVAAAEALLTTLDDSARQSREEMMGAQTDHLRLSIDNGPVGLAVSGASCLPQCHTCRRWNQCDPVLSWRNTGGDFFGIHGRASARWSSRVQPRSAGTPI